jgi:hypothetical protein
MDLKLQLFGWGSVWGPGCKVGLWDVPRKFFGPACGGWNVPLKRVGCPIYVLNNSVGTPTIDSYIWWDVPPYVGTAPQEDPLLGI